MVTTWGATLAWSATTVTVAGAVDAVDGRLGCRLGCIRSGVVAGVWATVDAAGATVCARPAMFRLITAVPAIKNANTRWEIVFIVLLNITTTNFGCSD